MGPSAWSRAASYSSRLSASRARWAMCPVSPVPPLAARLRQPRRRYERSSSGSSRPPSSSSSSTACSASASSGESRSSTGESPDRLTDLLQVDAVLGDDEVQVSRGAAYAATPRAVEDVGFAGVGLGEDAVLRRGQSRRVRRELAGPDRVS